MSEAKHGRLPEEVARYFEQMSPQERIQAVLSVKAPNDQRFISAWAEQQCKVREVKLLSPTRSLVTFSFRVEKWYCNGSGNLHGNIQP